MCDTQNKKATFWDGSSSKDAVYVETKSPIAVERRFMRRYNRKPYFKELGQSIVWQAYKLLTTEAYTTETAMVVEGEVRIKRKEFNKVFVINQDYQQDQ